MKGCDGAATTPPAESRTQSPHFRRVRGKAAVCRCYEWRPSQASKSAAVVEVVIVDGVFSFLFLTSSLLLCTADSLHVVELDERPGLTKSTEEKHKH